MHGCAYIYALPSRTISTASLRALEMSTFFFVWNAVDWQVDFLVVFSTNPRHLVDNVYTYERLRLTLKLLHQRNHIRHAVVRQ